MDRVFKDLVVVELAGVLAGPSVGYFFAELGAKVIKVENPENGGDVTRSWKLKTEDTNEKTSAYFWSINAFKEQVWLDLRKVAHLDKLYNMLKTADIVITNFKHGDDVKLKVDYETVRSLNPKIIYASINGFGNNSQRTAYDLILQAESGFMSMNGEPNSKALKMPVALIDVLAGHQLKEAVLIALLNRYKENNGSYITVSLFDSALASLVNQATNWLVAKHLAKPSGSTHPNIAPYGELFETKDKHLITFAIGSNKQFKNLCEIISYKALANDARFATNHARVGNRTELYSMLYDYIKQFPFKTIFDLCSKHDVPVGKIRNIKEVFELPEAKNMLVEVTHGGKKITAVSGIAFKFLK